MLRDERRKGPAVRLRDKQCGSCPLNPKSVIENPKILPKFKRDQDDLMSYRKRRYEEQKDSPETTQTTSATAPATTPSLRPYGEMNEPDRIFFHAKQKIKNP